MIETKTDVSERLDSGNGEACHIVCNVHEDKTLCGLVDQPDNWCPDPLCEKECLVCLDLEPRDVCPVCKTECWKLGT